MTKEMAQMALDVQSACNLSGILHSLGKMLPAVWDDVHASGKPFVEHPVVRLFVEQIAFLGRASNMTSYSQAYEACCAAADVESHRMAA